MSSEFTYTGVVTRPVIENLSNSTTSGRLHSLKVAANFDGSKIAISDEYLCKVTLYDYDKLNNSWIFETELTSGVSLASNGFGVSVSMDWDADRIVVGANTISNVYTFDYINGSWNTTPRVIEGTTGSGFGFSVSIAGNDADILCVGAPLENKVYVYQDIQGNWNQTYVNDGTSILSRIPLTPTSNVILKPEYNAYGYHVYMESEGNYFIAGAPGQNMSNILTSNILHIETNGIFSDPPPDLDYPFDVSGTAVGVPPNSMKHVGNIRVFGINDAGSWAQIGGDLEGDPRNYILEDGYDGYIGYNNYIGWSMPGFGTCTHISNELIITVSSPGYPLGGQYDFYGGKISRFKFSTDVGGWIPYGLDSISRFGGALYGETFTMDYAGVRIAIGLQSPFLSDLQNQRLLPGRVYVLEWNEDTWHESQEIILLEDTGLINPGGFDRVQPTIVNGKNVFCTSVRRGKMYTKDFELTQVFQGNNIFTGYISAGIIKVGDNNGDPANLSDKKILFGGTRGDQSYEYTSIENRSLLRDGKSEILHSKRSPNLNQIDIIRLKANEIHLDNHSVGTVLTRVLDDPQINFISQSVDLKETHRPSLMVNWRGDVCVMPHINQDLSIPIPWYGGTVPDWNPGSCDSKAALDVNGDVFIRNRVNINDFDKNRINGAWITQPTIFYNTRDLDVLYRDPNQTSRILVRSVSRPFEDVVMNFFGLVEGTVNYSENYRGFEFIGNGKITNVLQGLAVPNTTTRHSFWILLQNEQSTYTTSNIFSVASGEVYRDKATSVTFQMTTTGFKFLYEDLKGVEPSFYFSCDASLQKDTWYNIQIQLMSGRDVVPQVTDDTNNNSYIGIWIDTVSVPLTLSGVAFENYQGFTNHPYIVGGNTENIILGMIMFYPVYPFSDITNPSSDEKLQAINNAYKYGPPPEMLVVGGDATISGKLGIGVTNPTEALEVSGNIRSYGNVYVGNNTNDTTPKSIYFGGVLGDDLYDHCVIENRIYGGTEKSELLLFKGNDPDSTNGPDRIRLRASEIVLDTYDSVTSDRTVENPRLIIDKDGGVTVLRSNVEIAMKTTDEDQECRLFFGTPLNSTSPLKTAIIAGGFGWSRSNLYFCLDNTLSNDPIYEASIANNSRMVIQASGTVGIGTVSPSNSYKLDVNGSIQCNGFNNTASDDRIKYKEEPVSNALTNINLLKPQKYEKIIEFPSDPEGHWIPTDEDWESTKESFKYTNEYGLIAQDVREIQELSFLVEGDETYSKTKSISVEEYDANIHTEYSPDNVYIHSVTSNIISESVFNTLTPEEQVDYVSNVQSYSTTIQTDTPLSLNYNGIFVLAVGAIQELDKKNKALEAQLTSVLARLDTLENPG